MPVRRSVLHESQSAVQHPLESHPSVQPSILGISTSFATSLLLPRHLIAQGMTEMRKESQVEFKSHPRPLSKKLPSPLFPFGKFLVFFALRHLPFIHPSIPSQGRGFLFFHTSEFLFSL